MVANFRSSHWSGGVSVLAAMGVLATLGYAWSALRAPAGLPHPALMNVVIVGSTVASAVSTGEDPMTSARLVQVQPPHDGMTGSATLELADGRQLTTGVGRAVVPAVTLVSVGIDSATFLDRGAYRRLNVAWGAASPKVAPIAPALPGIDFDSNPGAANPAMARR